MQVYEELQSQALSLMTDQFGNYVIQKLLDHGGPKVRHISACNMCSHVSAVIQSNSAALF